MKLNPILTILFVFLSATILVSCNKEGERVSSSTNYGSPTPTPLPSNNPYPDLSPLRDADQVFYFLGFSTYAIICRGTYCTIRSRYIFHSDSSFLLQYNYDDGNEYRRGIQYKGRYTITNNNVSFIWEGWSTAGPWGATGILQGDTLKIGYNTIMTLTDFEDAMYMRKR